MSSIKSSKKSANNPAVARATPTERPLLPAASSSVPSLAMRCDGRVLLTTVDLESVDLSKRELWLGVVLTDDEASAIRARINFDEAASPTVARLRALDKKPKGAAPGDDDDDSGSGEQ